MKSAAGKNRPKETTKAEQTRARILETAMKLFLKSGYDSTTMRDVAKAAGLSPGAAYYYFPSKEHIIQHYYEQGYREQQEAAESVLKQETELGKRIAGVIRAHMEVARPYHSVSRVLFKTAADPTHPISPFSDDSKELRGENIRLFADLLGGTKTSLSGLPKTFRERLPELLWLYKMGIILYWIHDRSPNQEKTFKLIDLGSALITRIILASRVPGLKTIATRGTRLFDQFKPYE